MKAVTWHGKRDVRVDTVPDPRSRAHRRDHRDHLDQHLRVRPAPLRDARRVHETGGHPRPRTDGHRPRSRRTTSAICASATGWSSRSRSPAAAVTCATSSCSPNARPPRCATRAWEPRCSATPSSTAKCPGGQAELLRVPQAQFTHIKVPVGPPDSRFVYLSDVLPTAWQAVAYADIPDGGSVAVLGLGPIGDMAARIAASSGLPRHRRRPGARAAGPRRASAASTRSISGELDDPRRRDPRPDRRARHRLGDRRGRAWRRTVPRLPSSPSRSTGLLPDAVAKPSDAEGGRGPPRLRCTPPSTSCGAAERSR